MDLEQNLILEARDLRKSIENWMTVLVVSWVVTLLLLVLFAHWSALWFEVGGLPVLLFYRLRADIALRLSRKENKRLDKIEELLSKP